VGPAGLLNVQAMNPAPNVFEEFILALDAAIKEGARAEQALRAYVLAKAERIRHHRQEERERSD
jgi:hypothetical protein